MQNGKQLSIGIIPFLVEIYYRILSDSDSIVEVTSLRVNCTKKLTAVPALHNVVILGNKTMAGRKEKN